MSACCKTNARKRYVLTSRQPLPRYLETSCTATACHQPHTTPQSPQFSCRAPIIFLRPTSRSASYPPSCRASPRVFLIGLCGSHCPQQSVPYMWLCDIPTQQRPLDSLYSRLPQVHPSKQPRVHGTTFPNPANSIMFSAGFKHPLARSCFLPSEGVPPRASK